MWIAFGIILLILWITLCIRWLISVNNKDGRAGRKAFYAIACFLLMIVAFASSPSLQEDTDVSSASETNNENKKEADKVKKESEPQLTAEEAKLKKEADAKQKLEDEAKAAETAKLKAEADKIQARTDSIASQFSLWDGSHTVLKEMIKDAMNDPDSFEHDETTYRDDGDFITVQTKYRGKNGFGGVVRGSVIATFSLDGEFIEVLSQE
jgi:hypothetical protein